MKVAIGEAMSPVDGYSTNIWYSGVIHAGIYYEPGSDMAYLCVEGSKRMYEYCEKKGLPHKRVGKLIVATREEELPVLHHYYTRAKNNKVQGLEILNSKQIQDLEPNVRALQALHSPNTGITDYAKVGLSYADDFLASGQGQIHSDFEVVGIEADEGRGVEIHGKGSKLVKSKWLITCAGLQSDYIGYMAGGKKGPTVLPFRGTYHELKPEARNIISRNIYPVPDPKYVSFKVLITPSSFPPHSHEHAHAHAHAHACDGSIPVHTRFRFCFG
ncbi:hypothetical protein L7F22_032853 [Adiantum nelumboides]|nr:hypothetical protein [Adiantum nelumboides]